MAGEAGGGALKVFLVEDSTLLRERLEAMIASVPGVRAAGHASAAATAIRDILAGKPDVVVLELKLAQGNGFEVLRALREAGSPAQVYVLSNFASEAYRNLAAALGARDFFDKSHEFERLRDALNARAARS